MGTTKLSDKSLLNSFLEVNLCHLNKVVGNHFDYRNTMTPEYYIEHEIHQYNDAGQPAVLNEIFLCYYITYTNGRLAECLALEHAAGGCVLDLIELPLAGESMVFNRLSALPGWDLNPRSLELAKSFLVSLFAVREKMALIA